MSVQFHRVTMPSEWPNLNRRNPVPRQISAEQQVELFSDEEFERFIDEWVYGYLKCQQRQYVSVERLGGAGDKGRDIIGWIDRPGTQNRRLDIYQCKHYDAPLTPSDYWKELAKLMYFTWKGDYAYPENYWIVASKGVGPKLSDLLNKPDVLKQALLSKWKEVSLLSVGGQAIILCNGLESYINSRDFSVIQTKSMRDILNEHAQTNYHFTTFGLALMQRPVPQTPPPSLIPKESHYIEQMMRAFSDHTKSPLTTRSDIEHKKDLLNQYDHARVCYYYAESLREFTKDATPNEKPFDDFVKQIHDGIKPTLYGPHEDGYRRMYAVCNQAVSVQLANNEITCCVEPNDRTGACHILANQDQLTWV